MQWVLLKQAGMSCSQVRTNPHQCRLLRPRSCQMLSLLPDRSGPAPALVQLMHISFALISYTAGEMVFPWMFEDFAALRPFKVSPAWPIRISSCGRMQRSPW